MLRLKFSLIVKTENLLIKVCVLVCFWVCVILNLTAFGRKVQNNRAAHISWIHYYNLNRGLFKLLFIFGFLVLCGLVLVSAVPFWASQADYTWGYKWLIDWGRRTKFHRFGNYFVLCRPRSSSGESLNYHGRSVTCASVQSCNGLSYIRTTNLLFFSRETRILSLT